MTDSDGGAVASGADDVDALVTALLTASRVLVAVSAESLTEVEDTVTLTQFRTLVVLHTRGTLNVSALADILTVNASTAVRSIDRLLAAGLVLRRENPSNRREVELDLTDGGRRLVNRVTTRRRTRITRIVSGMPDDERADLITALRSFSEAAGEPVAERSIGW